MTTLEPISDLDQATREKALAAIHHLEQRIVDPMTKLLWNNLFFRDSDGTFYATFHDSINLKTSWFREAGLFRISLYRYGNNVIATSDIHNDCGYDIWFVTNDGRSIEQMDTERSAA